MRAGKVWGTTEMLEANGVLEFHRIEMEKGGVCSKHLHKYKWNGFYVERGSLLVRVWQNDYNLIDETILEAGQYTKVKPGIYHQFECLEGGVAFELYWAEFNHSDIVRETVGFNYGNNFDSSYTPVDSTFTLKIDNELDNKSNLNINTIYDSIDVGKLDC